MKKSKYPKQFKITLTEKHCKNGNYAHGKNCPIAKCLKHNNYKTEYVFPDYIDLIIKNKVFLIKKIVKYDILNNRGSSEFIESLIDKANEGEKFKRTINFKLIE